MREYGSVEDLIGVMHGFILTLNQKHYDVFESFVIESIQYVDQRIIIFFLIPWYQVCGVAYCEDRFNIEMALVHLNVFLNFSLYPVINH